VLGLACSMASNAVWGQKRSPRRPLSTTASASASSSTGASTSASAKASVPYPVPSTVESAAPAGSSAWPAASELHPAPSRSASGPMPASPSAVPAASVSRLSPAPKGEVKLRDQVVFVLQAPHAGQSAVERAQAASKALADALGQVSPDDVHVDMGPESAVVFAGRVPILELGPEDARLAGEERVSVHAQTVATRLREAIRAQKERSQLMKTVFSLALAVVFSLVALYAVRKVGEYAARARHWLEQYPERVPAMRLKSIEVVRPQTLRSGILAALGLGKWVVQFGVGYLWLLVVLLVLAPTSGYSARMTSFMLAPLSTLTGRIVGALPLMVVAVLAGIAVIILLRFVALFFQGVTRGETELAWCPRELASPTSLLVRAGIVVGALFFAAPVVTGDPEGAFTRLGTVVLVVLGFGCTPLAASGVIGALTLYTRRIGIGDFVELGGERGRVTYLGLLEVRLARDGTEVRVPHLVTLWHPTRVFGARPRVTVLLTVSPEATQSEVLELLQEAAGRHGQEPRVVLSTADAEGVQYRVSVETEAEGAANALWVELLDRLKAANVPLGRAPRTSDR
jgi:small-conductance mechanosensitive channel